MAPYYPITVHRSDGLLTVITKSGIKEANEPTAVQQNDTPDSKGNVDYYKRLDPKEPKAVDWRRKLGGMLMHLLGGKEHAGMSPGRIVVTAELILYQASSTSSRKFPKDMSYGSTSSTMSIRLMAPERRESMLEARSSDRTHTFTVTHKAERSDSDHLRISSTTFSG